MISEIKRDIKNFIKFEILKYMLPVLKMLWFNDPIWVDCNVSTAHKGAKNTFPENISLSLNSGVKIQCDSANLQKGVAFLKIQFIMEYWLWLYIQSCIF